MKLRILAFGSRGDVQPFVALSLALQRAGYDVTVAAALNFKSFVESYGLPALTTKTDLQQTVARSRGGRRAKWEFLQMMLDETLRLSEGADVLIYSPAAIFSAPHVVEKLHIPAITTALQPFLHASDKMPAVGMPALPVPGYNRWSYGFVEWFTWAFTRSQINRWRREMLGLPPASSNPFQMAREQSLATLYGISPLVMSQPPDWPDNVYVTGYWFLPPPDDWEPPEELRAFLEAGDPTVYLGFGSMASRDPEQTAEVVLEAVRRADVRAIIASGWGGMAARDVPDNILLIEGAPHEWLFPRMSAVVHHGGAGTTGAGLRAGVPSIIVPFKGDQPLWGRRVHELGAGPAPIPRNRLTAENLASALRSAVTDATMRAKAAALGEKIRAEDGAGNAVRAIANALEKVSLLNHR